MVTSHARYKIKHLIRAEEKARAIELGRKVFEKEARRHDLNPKTLIEGEAFGRLLSDFGVQKADEIFASIGYGKVGGEADPAEARPGRSAARKAARGAR